MKQCILVIFVNSLMSLDYDMLKELDNFKYIISKGTIVKEVINDYPNLRIPVSTTILTGELPHKHGIYFDDFNVEVRRYREKEYENIQVPTILDLFKENGNDVSVISWPVMGYSNFKYNFMDIKSTRFSDISKGILRGSSFYMMKNIFKYSKVLKINTHPEHDNFSCILGMELLESRKSNVIFMSFNHLDYVRRRYSKDSEQVYDALKSIDKKIGDILSWCDNKNLLNNLTLSIVSNGGVYNYKNSININYAFYDNGLITCNKKWKIKDYISYAHCNEALSFIYLKDPNNANDYGRVKVFLEEFSKNNSSFINKVYESHEFESYDLNNFSFVVESKPGCIFDSEINREKYIQKADLSKCALTSKVNKSVSGYSSEYENSRGIFLSYGNKVREGVYIHRCNAVDIAPTISSFMDLDFKCSGHVIKKIKK